MLGVRDPEDPKRTGVQGSSVVWPPLLSHCYVVVVIVTHGGVALVVGDETTRMVWREGALSPARRGTTPFPEPPTLTLQHLFVDFST